MMFRSSSPYWIALVFLASCMLLAGCTDSADYREMTPSAEPLHEAAHALTDVMVYDIYSPPQAARIYAYAGIAAYQTAQHQRDDFRSVSGQFNDLSESPVPPNDDIYLPLASVHAFLTVGRQLVASSQRLEPTHEELLQSYRDRGIPMQVFRQSLAYGESVADHVLEWAGRDRYSETRTYAHYDVREEPGRWKPTPPAYHRAVEPHWAEIRPFTFDNPDQFGVSPPAEFSLEEGSDFRRELMEVYQTVTDLSEEQRAIAAFWDCNPYVMNIHGHAMFATKQMTPGGHWMGIAAIASREAGADLIEASEAYMRVAVAVHDGFIVSWHEKYRSNLVRPETVINEHIDPSWNPVLQTPPFPEYTSGHSVISTAAALALTEIYGAGFAFEDTSQVEYDLPPRSFESFDQAAQEAAISRLYAGIHYPMAIEVGIEQGKQIGNHVNQQLITREPTLAEAP